uniref:Retrovirus-related Pol polyprotein from transposon TNT 1-94 n=1 Tax=Noccaea caerulescens TaxID=107243 RepID=A0A1J3F7G4_NOCCA
MAKDLMASTRVDVDRFDGTGDFGLWKTRMMAHFRILGLKDIITDFKLEKEVPVAETPVAGVSSKPLTEFVLDPLKHEKSEKALGMIINSVGDHVLRKIEHCVTAAEMWSLLDELYTESTLPNRIHLQLKFYTFKMNDSRSVDQNVDDFLKIVAEMNSLDVKVTDEVQAILFLTSLSSNYDQLAHTLKYGRETLTLKEVVSAVRSRERELAETSREYKNSAASLYTRERGRSYSKGPKDSNGRGRSRSNSRSRVTCWYCKKEGHVKKDCYARKKKFGDDAPGEAGVVTEKLVYSEALNVDDLKADDVWVLDSGCTFHMTARRDWFIDLQDNGGTTILLGDNHSIQSQGQGSIRINTHGGSIKVLHNVRYVPNLRRNLISTGTLDKLGYKHEGGDGKVRYFKNNKTALRGNLVNGLYILDGKTVLSESCNVEKKLDKTTLWHSRLGHMSINSLRVLSEKGLIDRKEVKDLEFCEHCVMGKSKRLSFNVGKHGTVDALGYVHADLWGSPNVTPSLSRKQYFLSIVDDKTRKVWLMFLSTKDETFLKFCEWQELVQNQVNKKVKVLRTDNGLEFCNTRFDDHCKAHGIERHRTCTYTPQQNGVAERMNRTIMEKVRCMLSESGLGEEFWAEAAATAAYLINRSPCSAIDHNVPEELWLNRKPGYKHLRRFGSVAYVHHDQGKLKPRALKGILLGYPQGTKGYKVWLMETEKCVISRNVVFHEELVFKDLDNGTEKGTDGNLKTGQSSETRGIEIIAETSSEGQQGQQQQVTENLVPGGATENGSNEIEEEEAEQIGEDEIGLASYQLARDRSRRIIAPPTRFNDYNMVAFALIVAEDLNHEEPQCYHEAMNSPEWVEWNDSMGEEMTSLAKNKTWIIVDRPKDKKVIGCRWLYRKKPGIPEVELRRFKSRLVARGFTQREGIDYDEVFAPVVKHVSIRILMSAVVNQDLELEQMDVKTAFLHGDLDQELFMEQPEGFEVDKDKDQVCLLKKSLYGLKQSPRLWNKKFNQFITGEKFIRSHQDSCVYVKKVEGGYVYLLLYVDDMLIAAKEMAEIDRLKSALSSEFEMKDMGAASRILGIDIKRDRKEGVLYLSQSSYLEKVVKRFNMGEAKSVNTPIGGHFKLSAVKEVSECIDTEKYPYSSAVGSVMYAMIGTRPDIAYAIGLISRFMSKPGIMHWEAVKWLLRYIRGTADLNLVFTKNKNFSVQGYCDSDFAGDLDRRRSTSGYVFTVGGNTVSWKSNLQPVVTLSTTEAEYVSLTEAVKEAIWIKGLLRDMGFSEEKAVVWCDSQSAICLSKNNVFHERTKHVSYKYHFIRDIIEDGEVEVSKVHTSENPADILTKSVPVIKFESALDVLRLIRIE